MKKNYTFILLLLSFSGFCQLDEGLLLNYDFNGNVNDISGAGYDGIPVGVTYGPDRYGNANSAGYFNGVDSYINFPNVDELKTPLPVTFSFWVRYESPNYQQQVILNTSFENDRSTGVWFNSTSATNQYALNYGDGSYSYTPFSRNTFVSTSFIVPTVWQHVVAVVNSATDMKIYIDKLDSTGYYSGSGADLVYSLTPGCIGRHDRDLEAPADYFHGYLDNFSYWNRALTPEEVEELYYLNAPQHFVQNAISVYPNPAETQLFIETSIINATNVTLYNNLGQTVYTGKFSSAINVSSLTSGLYILKIDSETGSYTKKIVIR